MNTCPNHPGKYAPHRDGNGGYMCGACRMRRLRAREKERKQEARPMGDCLCGAAAVVSIKTPNGRLKLCRQHWAMEQRQQQDWPAARLYAVAAVKEA